MSDIWFRIVSYFKRNPTRVAGYISTLTLYLNNRYPWLQASVLIPSIMFVIFMSEVAQREEHRNAIKALRHTSDPNIPDEEELKIVIHTKK